MIPKIIHFFWISDKQKVYPDLMQKCIDTWREVLPEYKIIKWDLNNFNVNSCPYVKEALAHRKYAFIADYIRLFALYTYGGIYLDTDVEVNKSFTPLLDERAFLGFEDEAHIATCVIGSEKENPLIKEFLDYYTDRHFEVNGQLDLTPNPVPLTKILQQHGLLLNNKEQSLWQTKILPQEYFSPKNFITGEIRKTENTYCIHHFNGSWLGKREKFKLRIIFVLKKFLGENFYQTVRKKYISLLRR